MEPIDTLNEWIRAFNARDILSLGRLYAKDAINHQVANEPVVGNDAIMQMFAREFAGSEMVCIPENKFADGDWAILEWRDPKGLRGCGFFQIQDGLIVLQRGYWDKLSFLRLHGLSEVPE